MDTYEDFFTDIKDIEEYTNAEHKKFKTTVEHKIFKDLEKNCEHKNMAIINGSEICSECGVVMETNIYYGQTENNYSRDPTRCHKRKPDERTISKDVERMEFHEMIVQRANKDYQKVIGNDIFRGARRRAIIVVCIYYAYFYMGEPRTSEDISLKFKIKKKNVKEGFTKYCERFPEASTQYIDAKNLIRQIMVRTNITFTHLRRINKLCDFLDNTSPLLNRSGPKSVAAALVYLYLCLETEYKEKVGMTKLKFADIVGLSDITITKLGKESQRIIQNEDIKL